MPYHVNVDTCVLRSWQLFVDRNESKMTNKMIYFTRDAEVFIFCTCHLNSFLLLFLPLHCWLEFYKHYVSLCPLLHTSKYDKWFINVWILIILTDSGHYFRLLLFFFLFLLISNYQVLLQTVLYLSYWTGCSCDNVCACIGLLAFYLA